MRTIILLLVLNTPLYSMSSVSFKSFVKNFVDGYNHLQMPPMEYSYRSYMSNIPTTEKLQTEEGFFVEQQKQLSTFDSTGLSASDLLDFNHLRYEIDFNLERIQLEKQWVLDGRKIPDNGLYGLDKHQDWYRHFVEQYSGTGITPEQVYALGQAEVNRVKNEIRKIRLQLGFTDSAAFYTYLKSDTFYITGKQQIIAGFARIDSQVRLHLPAFFGNAEIPVVYAMQWPDAGPTTPPGIYLNKNDNPYGKNVFQYNFYGGRYNRRAMEWLYMHEAIPGHHLQFSFFDLNKNKSPLHDLFSYPGNFEGWACYIEYQGKDFGLYTNPYAYLGKWEWDLVRSARLVIDVGIHYYGWTRQQALDYWKATIPGQDDIAEREVSRVTNWPAQALSYKTGADFISKLKVRWQQKYPQRPIKDFYRSYFEAGMVPLTVMGKKLMSN
jgi:uncharacterized protein (DUF885 family)